MEWLIATFGAKFCCITASGAGGICNWLTHKKAGIKDVVVALVVGWLSAEFVIPAIMKQFELDMTMGPMIAIFIGYSGVRFLQVAEKRFLAKIGNT